MARDNLTFRPAVTLISLLACAACGQLGLPPVDLAVASPDGRTTAEVRNHPAMDPPNQSLWLVREGGQAVKVEKLPGDGDWCDAVAWSGDGATVAFLIRGQRLLVVEAATGDTVFDARLPLPRSDRRPHFFATGVRLSHDGRHATYRPCRRDGECGEVREVDLTADTPRSVPVHPAPTSGKVVG